jgi:hypothetical protein
MTATGRLKCQPGAEDRQEPLPFSAGLDGKRVATLLGRVRAYMLGNGWRSLGEIALALGRGSEAGISARLRDLRKEQPGCGLRVEKRRRGDPARGLWEYRVRAIEVDHA